MGLGSFGGGIGAARYLASHGASVTVTDTNAPGCAQSLGTMTVGQTQTYTCSRASVTADFTNTAAVSGNPPVGPPVTDQDDAVVDVIEPDIDVEKTPDTQQVVSGADVTFTITVTNNGDVDLTSVTVTDANAPGCDRTYATLTVGETQTYTCSRAAVVADFTNTAEASGNPPSGPPVTDQDDAVVDVIHPSIFIDKAPDLRIIDSGEDVEFTITVSNNGDVDLANVTVADPNAPDCDQTYASLTVGETQTYTCERLAVTADFTNTATVTGTPPIGPDVTDQDSARVQIRKTGPRWPLTQADPIPTLNEWGVVGLALLMVLMAAIYLRKRRVKQS